MEAYFAGKIIKLNGGFTCYPCHDIQAKEQISSQVSPGVSGLTTKHQSRLCLFFFLCGSSSNGSPQKKEPEIYRCWSPQIHRSWTQNYKEFLEDGWKNGWSRGCTLCETAMGFCWKATHVPWIAESFYDSFYGIWALWYLQSLAGEHVERWQEGPGIPLLRKKLLDFSWVWLAHLTGLKSVWICNPS